jgi:hypothetical protein
MFFNRKKKTENDQPETKLDLTPQEQEAEVKEDNNEIIAVIAAALSMYETQGIKLKVKSIRRLPQLSPVWNLTGRLERLSEKLM